MTTTARVLPFVRPVYKFHRHSTTYKELVDRISAIANGMQSCIAEAATLEQAPMNKRQLSRYQDLGSVLDVYDEALAELAALPLQPSIDRMFPLSCAVPVQSHREI